MQLTPTRRWAAASAVGVALLSAQSSWFLPFIADDALISLRYAVRLADGEGLTFTDGERVEGYSNLLLVLAVAGLAALGSDPIQAVRAVGLAGAVLAVGAVAWAGRRGGEGLAAAALVGGSLGLGAWVVGGLEQPLLAGSLAAALALLIEPHDVRQPPSSPSGPDPARPTVRLRVAGALLGLACLTRPDAPLFAAIAVAFAAADGWRSALAVGAPPAVAACGQLAFRLAYHGDWVPNPAHVKLAFGLDRLAHGAEYVRDGLLGVGVLVALAGVGAWRTPGRARALLVASAVGWLAYVAFVGGDIFPARRHLVPALVPLALLAGRAFPPGWLGSGAALLAVPAHLATQLVVDPAYSLAKHETWEWDCAAVAEPLGLAFREQRPLLAVNAAGCWPYFSRLPALDMLGLNDRHIARTPPQGDQLGHDRGDGAYVLSRAPDLVVMGPWFGVASGGFPGDLQLAALPAFRRDYRLIRVERAGTRVSALMWVRVDSPRIGPRALPDGTIAIPPWMFAGSEPATTARVSSRGDLVVRLRPGEVVVFEVDLPAGRWRAEVDADLPVVAEFPGRRQSHAEVKLDAPRRVPVRLQAPEGATIRRVRITGV